MDYQEFREEYERRHPASIPKLEEEIGIYPDWLEKVVGVMFICASLLSGVHTVPAVRNGMDTSFWGEHIVNGVSLSSFVAIELVFFVAAYAMMRKAQWHVMITLIVAFIVAMVANLQQNIMAYQAGDPGTIIVAGTLGIGAPLIAFMAGKMFVDIHRARRMVGIDAKRRYDEAAKQWDSEIEKEYKKWLKDPTKSSIVQPSNERPMDVSTGQQPVPAASRLGHDRVPDASERVRQFFTENERALWDDNLGVRKIADHLGVGRQTVANVRQELRAKTKASNGHSEPVGQ